MGSLVSLLMKDTANGPYQDGCGKTSKDKSLDMVEVWKLLESQLHEAELSCVDIETPEDLLYIKAALCADATALEAASEVSATTTNGASNGRRGARSPIRSSSKDGNSGEEEDALSTSAATGSRKKSRSERAARRGDDGGSSSSSGTKRNYEWDKNADVIPWSCRTMPRTPHGVALYLSNLSNSPELAAAFACDSIFGCVPQSLSWLEGNLPIQATPGAAEDSERLRKIREEVAQLTAELKTEVDTNSNLQKEIVEGRKRSDEICAMMTMIRSETEAVVERHNQVLGMNEHLEGYEDEDDMGEEPEEGEIEDDEEGIKVAEEHEERSSFIDGDLNEYGNYDASDEDDGDGQPVREVIVPSQNVGNGDQILNAGNTKRGYAETSDIADPEKKRRKV